MSLRRQLAELLVLRCSGHLLDQQRRYPKWEASNAELQHWLAEGVGGVILLGGSAAELALRCRQLQQWASTPLLLCADVEEGVGQRFEGASWLVPPLALGGCTNTIQPQQLNWPVPTAAALAWKPSPSVSTGCWGRSAMSTTTQPTR